MQPSISRLSGFPAMGSERPERTELRLPREEDGHQTLAPRKTTAQAKAGGKEELSKTKGILLHLHVTADSLMSLQFLRAISCRSQA